ncbi:MAG: right-handed parallel beta-helix repeat-containing protein, partial [Anaerolineaceae bacterium]|nr:right-handed parallel beta-helix repeat-containing protein [Anaerolineaceae bacterium]
TTHQARGTNYKTIFVPVGIPVIARFSCLGVNEVHDDYSGKYKFELYEYVDDDANGLPDDYGKDYRDDGLGGIGILIENSSGAGGVTVTNPVTSRTEVGGNSGDGLWIRSNGAVLVNNLNANDNGNMGVNITTNYDNPVIPANVTLSGLATNWNGDHGVGVKTLGTIMYSASTSGGNGYYAAYLDNCRPDGMGGCEATVMKPVTLTKLTLDNNAYGPAVVFSFGNITAGGIISRYNGGSGLALFNNYTNSTGTITLLGTLGQNVFQGNQLAGMRLYSNGSVTLSNFWVKDNGTTYVADELDPEAISAGMYIYAGGKITLSSGLVESNVRNGILMDAYNSVSMSKMTVFMNGWNYKEWNDKSGIEIRAHGVSPVTITSSLIFGNAKHGLSIIEGVGNPILTGTVFFGNDLDNSGDADVQLVH